MTPPPPSSPATAVKSARSFLFVPGDRPARFEKAVSSAADVVVIDLEDAVAAEQKDGARSATATWLADGGHACVRVNGPSSPFYAEDIAALAGLTGLVAVMLPKAERPETIAEVWRRLGVPVVPLVESATGIVRIHELASAPGVARLAFGHLDYALDIGAQASWTAMLHARSVLVLASRHASLPGPVDGVTTVLEDVEALAADVKQAMDLGFSAKLLVHPRQVAATHAALLPDEEDVRWARRVLAAAAGTEAARVDGQMVDAPVVARATAILRRSG